MLISHITYQHLNSTLSSSSNFFYLYGCFSFSSFRLLCIVGSLFWFFFLDTDFIWLRFTSPYLDNDDNDEMRYIIFLLIGVLLSLYSQSIDTCSYTAGCFNLQWWLWWLWLLLVMDFISFIIWVRDSFNPIQIQYFTLLPYHISILLPTNH